MKIITVLLLSLFSMASLAEQKPLWEAGLGLVTLYNPHYLGAEQQSTTVLPLPYFIYRGETLRADRGGIRGFLYDSEKLDLRLSLSGALPVNSEDNDAREGMDDLDLMLEIGPTLQYTIMEADGHLLRADFPVRAAFTVGDEFFSHQGWTSNPRFYYETDINRWEIHATLGLVFSDNRYHGYIYDVDQRDVRDDRAFYQSESGFTGGRFSVSTKRRFNDYFIGGSVRYYTLDNAKNIDSPLLKSTEYFALSLQFGWVFGESERRVDD